MSLNVKSYYYYKIRNVIIHLGHFKSSVTCPYTAIMFGSVTMPYRIVINFKTIFLVKEKKFLSLLQSILCLNIIHFFLNNSRQNVDPNQTIYNSNYRHTLSAVGSRNKKLITYLIKSTKIQIKHHTWPYKI